MTTATIPNVDRDHIARFYSAVLPPAGHRCLAVLKAGRRPVHEFFTDDASLIARALTLGEDADAYHGCAAYKTPGSRKGDNVQAVQALWIDLDVGAGKPYAVFDEALAALRQFTATVGLAEPFVVKSGGGVHAYLALEHAVTPEAWKCLAAVFAACMTAYGLKHDTSRTEDIASILRVPGTLNFKTDPPRAVTLISEGAAEHPAHVLRKLKAYASTNNVLLADAKPPKAKPAATNDLVGTREYLPSNAELIAERCPTLHGVATTGGDVSYEVWWRAIGVAKFTSDPERAAGHWTRNRADTGHSKHDWRAVLDQWTAGPTTCAEFAKHSSACAGCQHSPKRGAP